MAYLAGKELQLVVDEGDPPLSPGMRLRGIVVRYAPSEGPHREDGVVIEFAEPAPADLRGRYLFVAPRHEGRSIEQVREGTEVIANILLYERNNHLPSSGIGSVRLG